MCPSVYFHLEQWTRRVQGYQCCVDFRLGQILASFLHSCPLHQPRQALIVSYQNINWCGKWLKRVDILTHFYPKTLCSQSRLLFHGLDLKMTSRWGSRGDKRRNNRGGGHDRVRILRDLRHHRHHRLPHGKHSDQRLSCYKTFRSWRGRKYTELQKNEQTVEHETLTTKIQYLEKSWFDRLSNVCLCSLLACSSFATSCTFPCGWSWLGGIRW